ncbi:MAG TPA: ROK family transcriptional regulator [Longimicrobiaceae bacterium]|nr:ROK family transcriptional regulator [Longimicrobiaceae bacterium]
MRKIDTRDFRSATRSTSRQINRQIALNLVREHQPISRAELARRMKVGRATVTALVNELLADGSIYEGEFARAPRGRKPMMLHVRTRDRLVIAVDVRFSRTYVMLSDFSGTQIALETFETMVDRDTLLDEIALRVHRLLRAHGAEGSCEGIGVVIPGMVNRESGHVLYAPQLGWRNVEVSSALAERTGLPVHIENAPIACALAQLWLGQRGAATEDFVFVVVSDGVGVGAVVNGDVVHGHSHTGGEFGHIPLVPGGPRCLCGADGCLEALTSNLATIARYLGREITSPDLREILQGGGPTIDDVVTRAHGGDQHAQEALQETGRYLGLGLSSIVNGLNPAQIYLAGEITGAWDLIGPGIRAEIARRGLTPEAARTPVIPEPTPYPRLRGAIALVAAPVFAAPRVG